MKLYTDIVTDYLAGRSLAAHAQEWFFTQPGYCFQEPDGSDAQKAAVMQVYEQVLRTVETFVPGNRPVWDALFPDWQDILRGAETALIVGYPPPNDAVVLKSPAGVDTAVLDMGLWVQYLGAVPVERVAHNLLTHELCHVCIHRHRPELDAAQETGDYLSRLDAFTFDEGFAHFVSYNDREANQVDWDAPELRAVWTRSAAAMRSARQETQPAQQQEQLHSAVFGSYYDKYACMCGLYYLARCWQGGGSARLAEEFAAAWPEVLILQLHGFRGDVLTEHPVVLHEQQGRPECLQQLLDLDAGENVDVVQRLVPDVQMGGLAQAAGQQHLFLLSLAVLLHRQVELLPLKSQVAQDGQAAALVNAALL